MAAWVLRMQGSWVRLPTLRPSARGAQALMAVTAAFHQSLSGTY